MEVNKLTLLAIRFNQGLLTMSQQQVSASVAVLVWPQRQVSASVASMATQC